ncbi:unnamed protein product [Prorocentrum cordatum]|uniref:Uncharacterized protein n=1 Tax=Prorocentrum cordatum TaxID=2364126 RepID=A0ABN9VL77_9DINO|nr:unnamed protein product [Polarella glacialis]
MWLVGTFSWSYHGGHASSAEVTGEINHLHYVRLVLFLEAALVQAFLCITAFAALHKVGSITWPVSLQVLAFGAITGEVSAMGALESEVFNGDRGHYISMAMRVSEYCVVMCLCVVHGTLVWPLRRCSVHMTMTPIGQGDDTGSEYYR